MEVKIKSEPIVFTRESTCHLINSENVAKSCESFHKMNSKRQYPGVTTTLVGPETVRKKDQEIETKLVEPQMVRIKVEKDDDSYESSLVDVHGSTPTKMKIFLENSAREIHQRRNGRDWPESDYGHSGASLGARNQLPAVRDGSPMIPSPSSSDSWHEPKRMSSVDSQDNLDNESPPRQSPRSANSTPSVVVQSPDKNGGQVYSNHPLIVNSFHIEALPLPEGNQETYTVLPGTPLSEDGAVPSQEPPTTSNVQTSDIVGRMERRAHFNQQRLVNKANPAGSPNFSNALKSPGVLEEEVLWQQVQRYRDRKKPPNRIQPTLQEETIFMRYSQIRERRMREGRVVHRYTPQELSVETGNNIHTYHSEGNHDRYSPQCSRACLTVDHFNSVSGNRSHNNPTSHHEYTLRRRPTNSTCPEDSYMGRHSHAKSSNSPTDVTDCCVQRRLVGRHSESPLMSKSSPEETEHCTHSYRHVGVSPASNRDHSPSHVVERVRGCSSLDKIDSNEAEREIREDSSCKSQNCACNIGCIENLRKPGMKRKCSFIATNLHEKKHKFIPESHSHKESYKNNFHEKYSASSFCEQHYDSHHNHEMVLEGHDHHALKAHSHSDEEQEEHRLHINKDFKDYSYRDHIQTKYHHSPSLDCEKDKISYYCTSDGIEKNHSPNEEHLDCTFNDKYTERSSEWHHHYQPTDDYQYSSIDKNQNDVGHGTSDQSRSRPVSTTSAILSTRFNFNNQDRFEPETGEHSEAEQELQNSIQSPLSTDAIKGKNTTAKPPPVKAKNDDDIVCHVYGLLSLPGLKETKYAISLGELKRRVGMPECLTRVDMISYVRQAKTSGRILLDTNNVVTSNRSKPSVLSRVCENEAQVLAEGIHKMNMEYLPLKSMAKRTVDRYRGRGCEGCPDCRLKLRRKIVDVEITRNMLKDLKETLYDSQDEHEMAQFQLASHNFGLKNLMNHIKLYDRYFANLQELLQDE